jgi:hypothetical protein
MTVRTDAILKVEELSNHIDLLRSERDQHAEELEHNQAAVITLKAEIERLRAALNEHPLRYARITSTIEQVLFRRSLEKRLGGYVLETAIEIAEAIVGTQCAAHGQKVES